MRFKKDVVNEPLGTIGKTLIGPDERIVIYFDDGKMSGKLDTMAEFRVSASRFYCYLHNRMLAVKSAGPALR